jgi:hypothetical protein
MYEKFMNENEIQQNYNALKGRFNLWPTKTENI